MKFGMGANIGQKTTWNEFEMLRSFFDQPAQPSDYAGEVLEGVEVPVSWKIHILVCHVGQWLDDHPVGLGLYAAQTCESTHADFKSTQKRFAVAEANPDHSTKLKRAVVDYSSKRL